MPIYIYKCQVCGEEFEYKQSIKDEPLKECPDEICELHRHQKGPVTRVISKNIGLVFKGSGFYLTDYAKNKSVSSAPSTNGTANGLTNGNTHTNGATLSSEGVQNGHSNGKSNGATTGKNVKVEQ